MKPALGIVLLLPGVAAAAEKKVPSVDEMIGLKRPLSAAISPDGRFVAYTVRETDWEDNAFDTEIWLADVGTGATRQLTRGKKSSTSPAWSPDGAWLAFASDREDKRQIYLLDARGGEARVFTTAEDGVNAFAWSPDGKQIAYTASEPRNQAAKDRDKQYGEFSIVDEDRSQTHLWTIDVATREARRLTSGQMAVGSFSWSPDSSALAFDHRVDGDAANGGTADISIVEMSRGTIRALVTQQGPDTGPRWSPDGSRLGFATSMGNADYYSRVRQHATPTLEEEL